MAYGFRLGRMYSEALFDSLVCNESGLEEEDKWISTMSDDMPESSDFTKSGISSIDCDILETRKKELIEYLWISMFCKGMNLNNLNEQENYTKNLRN